MCLMSSVEEGPVDEVLMDNSTAFRTWALKNMFDKWQNGQVEMVLTKRVICKRCFGVLSPRTGQDERTVPQNAVFQYESRPKYANRY